MSSALTKIENKQDPNDLIWQKLENLSPRHASASSVIEEFVSNFLNDINKSYELTRIQKSYHGKTDLTFMCQRSFLVENSPSRLVRFVLKMTSPYLGVSAQVNSKALVLLGMEACEIFVLPKENRCTKSLYKLKKEEFYHDRYHLVFMRAFPGANFGQHLENRSLFKLSQEDWGRLLEKIGMVAVFDLALGNDDRFYRPSINGHPEDAEPFCNLGNFMFYAPLDPHSENGRSLKGIYCIDNVSAKSFYPPVRDVKEKYNQAFFKAFAYYRDEKKHAEFGEMIFRGFRIRLIRFSKGVETTHQFDDKGFAVSCISKGVEKGYQQISSVYRRSFIEELNSYLNSCRPDQASEEYGKNTIDLLDRCINLMQGGN